MSDSELPAEAQRDGPRFRRVEQRRRVALARYYGTGSGEEWDIPEIAEYLRVSEDTVESYIYDTEMGDKVREVFPAAEERMKMDILLEKKERLEILRDMFRDKMEEKDVAVTGHRLESVTGEMNMENVDGVRSPTGDSAPKNRVTLDAPAPDEFEERSVMDDESRAILREIREHENDIREMLSLDEPDEVHTEHHGDAVVEQKIYNFDGADQSLPDAQVVDIEAEEVDTSDVGPNDE